MLVDISSRFLCEKGLKGTLMHVPVAGFSVKPRYLRQTIDYFKKNGSTLR